MEIPLNTLPVCTFVLDKNAKLLDINQVALDFLRFEDVVECRSKEWAIKTDYYRIETLIQELKKGKIIQNESALLKCSDNSLALVKLCANRLNGENDFFLFHFFELSNFRNFDSQLHDNIISLNNENVDNLSNNLIEVVVTTEPKKKQARKYSKPQESYPNIDENVYQFITDKYPILTHNEVVLCYLIAKGNSTNTISEIMRKYPNNIFSAIHRILYKLELNTRDELNLELMNTVGKCFE